ncbi:alcohol acetyltransferase [Mariannaea sp. PMI_226]|nr:alcohol acetyltransferase [Mariannaea sp. PMI_226]
MFYLQHRVGAQSNIVVSAHYTHAKSTGKTVLSREAVYAAVRSVIASYPELSIVGIQEPLPKKGHHKLSNAALHEIDVEACVEFYDDEPPSASAKVMERLHNQWDWTDEKFNPRQPWWKVVILGRQEVAFVFHHFVCDGRFGQFFHDAFLTAINSFNEKDQSSSNVVKINSERVRLDKDLQEFWTSSISFLYIIHELLSLLIIRLFFGSRLMFANLAKPKPHGTSVATEASPSERTKTRVCSRTIPASQMSRIITACREHNVTFTPLLCTLAMATFACDYYPNAKVGISNCALDARSIYASRRPGSQAGRFINCSNGAGKFTWLPRYRRVFDCPTLSNEQQKKITVDGEKTARIDVDGAWKLVKEYRANLTNAMEGSSVLRSFRAGNSVSNALEDMLSSTFPMLGVYMNNSLNISNLGAFKTTERAGPWKIDDMSFSASCVNGNIFSPVSFQIVGVDGGNTVVMVSYEDGIVSEDMISGMLEGTFERIEAMDISRLKLEE